MTRQLDLFGSSTYEPARRRRKDAFNDYDGFVEKFKPKKTTDDCMCHLSAECGGCCVRCIAEGRNGTCHGQICSQPGRDHMGRRFETWMYIVRNFRPDLKRYLPRKYWKLIERKR